VEIVSSASEHFNRPRIVPEHFGRWLYVRFRTYLVLAVLTGLLFFVVTAPFYIEWRTLVVVALALASLIFLLVVFLNGFRLRGELTDIADYGAVVGFGLAGVTGLEWLVGLASRFVLQHQEVLLLFGSLPLSNLFLSADIAIIAGVGAHAIYRIRSRKRRTANKRRERG
jgi:hypothetical protein